MKKSRRTYNGVHLNKKSNTQDVVEQSLTFNGGFKFFSKLIFISQPTFFYNLTQNLRFIIQLKKEIL